MAQPTTYDRQYNFEEYQALHPSTPLPGDQADLEFNAVKITLDEIMTNLALIQRDDGELVNDSVGLAQLKGEVSVGLSPATMWITAHNYFANNTVFKDLVLYRCLVSHTSGVFATDLAALKWVLVADFASFIADLITGVDTIVVLPTETTATRYISNTGVGSIPAWAQVNLANGVTGVLPQANGGTGAVSVMTFGAVADGSDVSVEIQAAITALQNSGGGELLIPAGDFKASGLVVTGSVKIMGAGINATILRAGSTDATVINLGGNQSSIEDLTMFGKGIGGDTGTFGAANHAFIMAANAGYARNLRVWGGASAMHVTTNDCEIENVDAGNSYGIAAVSTVGSNWYVRNKFDHGVATVAATDSLPYSARANTTAYTVGQIRSSGGYLIQCTVAGTSGGSSPTLKNYGIDIIDGTVTWLLLAPVGYVGFYELTGSLENRMVQTDFSGLGYEASVKIDAVGSWTSLTDCVMNAPIQLVTGSWCIMRGCTFGDDITVQAAFSSSVIIEGNGCTGAIDILVAANKTNFVIANNDLPVGSTIVVQPGTSDNYTISGNGGATIDDGGTGVNKHVPYTPLPAFLAYNSATDSNVTGNTEVITVDFNTEVFDRAGNFAADTFTAPYKGLYAFSGAIQLTDVTGAFTIDVNLVTSNRSYRLFFGLGSLAVSGIVNIPWSVAAADMDAGDTAVVTVMASGGGTVVDIGGASGPGASFFSGHMIV